MTKAELAALVNAAFLTDGWVRVHMDNGSYHARTRLIAALTKQAEKDGLLTEENTK